MRRPAISSRPASSAVTRSKPLTLTALPEAGVDLWTDEALSDPYPRYRMLRDLGVAVRLPEYGVVALPRFAEVRDALRDWQTFSSAYGVGLSEDGNARNRGSLLTSDGAEHVALRKIVGRPLGSDAMRAIRDTISAESRSSLREFRRCERSTGLATWRGIFRLPS